MSTQHCLQTVVGHRCEIWSLAVVEVQDSLSSADLLVTGSSDEFLRGYRVRKAASAVDPSPTGGVLDQEDVLEYCGCVSRPEASAAVGVSSLSGSNDRCTSLRFSPVASRRPHPFHNLETEDKGTWPVLMAAQTSGKTVEVDTLLSCFNPLPPLSLL